MDFRSVLQTIRDKRYHLLKNAVLRRYFQVRGNPYNAKKVANKDWDILVILDACRYDFFEKHHTLEGDLKKTFSLGTQSLEFLQRNFTEKHEDIVYVSANPQVHPANPSHWAEFDGEQMFHEVKHVFLNEAYQVGDLRTGSDNIGGVTHPEFVTEEAIETHREFPDRRIIAHYMQPHDPYIGSNKVDEDTFLKDLREKGLSKEEIQGIYIDNLRFVCDYVKELRNQVEGKIAVTSDHGELLGEYGLWGHPYGVYLPELVEVPWLVMEGEKPDSTNISI